MSPHPFLSLASFGPRPAYNNLYYYTLYISNADFVSSHDQLKRVLDVLGTPTIEEFYGITSSKSKNYIRGMEFKKKVPFENLYPNANPLAIDFLTKTLTCE